MCITDMENTFKNKANIQDNGLMDNKMEEEQKFGDLTNKINMKVNL